MELLAPRGLSGTARNIVSGPVRSVADFYIPFRIFQVEIQNAGEKTNHVFGLDAVNGSLDLYTWEHLPAQDEMFLLETRNRLPVTLSEEEGQGMVADKVRRLIFAQGFSGSAISASPPSPFPEKSTFPIGRLFVAMEFARISPCSMPSAVKQKARECGKCCVSGSLRSTSSCSKPRVSLGIHGYFSNSRLMLPASYPSVTFPRVSRA